MVLGPFVAGSALAVLAAALFVALDDFTAYPLFLSPPPRAEGALRPRPVAGAETLPIRGAESMVIRNGAIFTCSIQAKCVKIVDERVVQSIQLTEHRDCDGSTASFSRCGRPLGIRWWYGNRFLVADPVYGIIAVDYDNEKAEIIFAARNSVGGMPQKFPDDLDVYDNDTIIYSDASTKYSYLDFMLPFLANEQDGRLIWLKLSTGEARVLVDKLSFPNGVQIHPDRKSVIFAESVTAKLYRYYFAGPSKGKLAVFCDALPGFPDNIRLSADGRHFYLAMFSSRWSVDDANLTTESIFDYMAPRPWLRKIFGVLIKYLPYRLLHLVLHSSSAEYGIFLVLDLDGRIVDSYHDSNGTVIREVTQVTDDGEKYLYLGTFMDAEIRRVLKH